MNKRNSKEENLQNKLNGETGEGKAEVSDVGEEFEVFFIDSNRYYTVDKNGNIGEPQEFVQDKSPGDITKDKNGDTLDGSINHPYEIWCIEDLVVFSNLVNGEGIELKDGKAVKIENAKGFISNTSESTGGIFGRSEGDTSIYNSYNIGEIAATGYQVGGIVGYCVGKVNIKNTYNSK